MICVNAFLPILSQLFCMRRYFPGALSNTVSPVLVAPDGGKDIAGPEKAGCRAIIAVAVVALLVFVNIPGASNDARAAEGVGVPKGPPAGMMDALKAWKNRDRERTAPARKTTPAAKPLPSRPIAPVLSKPTPRSGPEWKPLKGSDLPALKNYDPTRGLDSREIEFIGELTREQRLKTERGRSTFSPAGLANLDLAKSVVQGATFAGLATLTTAGFAVTAPVVATAGVVVFSSGGYVQYEKSRAAGKSGFESFKDALWQGGKDLALGVVLDKVMPGATVADSSAAEDVVGRALESKVQENVRNPSDNARPNYLWSPSGERLQEVPGYFHTDGRLVVDMRPAQ